MIDCKTGTSLVSIILALIIMVGCDSVNSSEENGLGDSFFSRAEQVSFTTVTDSVISIKQSDFGSYAFQDKTNRVITNSSEFEQLWKDLHASRSPIPKLPEVNFEEYTVLASMMGVQSSGGFHITIQKVGVSGDMVGVQIEEVEPGQGCITISALTSPFHIVKVPKIATGQDVRFATNRSTKVCEE